MKNKIINFALKDTDINFSEDLKAFALAVLICLEDLKAFALAVLICFVLTYIAKFLAFI